MIKGTLSFGTSSGVYELALGNAKAAYNATGTVKVGDTSYPVNSVNFDPATGAFSFETAVVAQKKLAVAAKVSSVGTISGKVEQKKASGEVVATGMIAGFGATTEKVAQIRNFLGTFGYYNPSGAGIFNVTVDGDNKISGFYNEFNYSGGQITGKLEETTITGTAKSANGVYTTTVTGTLSGNSVSGTFTLRKTADNSFWGGGNFIGTEK